MSFAFGHEQGEVKIMHERKLDSMCLRKLAYANGFESPTHCHENARFVFVLKGTFSEKYGRRARECKPFAIIFRPPGEPHSEFYHDNGVVCLSVDISSAWMESLKQQRVLLDDSTALCDRTFSSGIVKLNEELSTADDISEVAIHGLMLESAVALHRKLKFIPNGKNPSWIRQAEDFIHDNSSSKLTLETIATAAGVHPISVARAFHGKHNCTVAEYVRRFRTESARLYLTSSRLSLVQIAAETGFSDQSHFSRLFKRQTGVTPAEYRRNFRSGW